MILILLIIFFIVLILYQLVLANYVVEGLENNDSYKPYDTNNPDNVLILAQQNAGNINFLKSRLDNLQGLNQQVQDLSNNYQGLQSQVDQLITAQKDYTSQMIGDTPPEISGAVSDEPIDSSTFVTE